MSGFGFTAVQGASPLPIYPHQGEGAFIVSAGFGGITALPLMRRLDPLPGELMAHGTGTSPMVGEDEREDRVQ